MKRSGIKKWTCAVLAMILCLLPAAYSKVWSFEGTSYTYTIASDWTSYIRTHDAYMPAGTYLAEAGLSSPEDLFYKEGVLYIADSGNGRIVRYQTLENTFSYLGEGELQKPTGVAIGPDGRIYVADYQAEQVVIFTPEGKVQKRIGRPEDVFYGSSPYKPMKVDVDSYSNIFVISEGTHEGILQFNQEGVFSGFFGANKTKGLNLVEWFQKVFYTDIQKSKLFYRTPPNIVSLDVASSDLVYSVTQNDRKGAIKKLNMAGVNIMSDNFINFETSYVDTAVAANGTFYAVTDTGFINEFNETGLPMLYFSGRATTTDRNGLTAVVSAIDVDENYNIYILDKERGLLQLWYPTDYAMLLHQAEDDFLQGHYKESLTGWSEILRMNPVAFMAHDGYAKTMFQLGKYDIAAKHYETISYRYGYSECYWEIRSEWMRTHVQGVLGILIAFFILQGLLWLVRKKVDYRQRAAYWRKKIQKNHPFVGHLFSDPFYIIRHPIDGVYYLKTGERGSMTVAVILYLTAYLVYMVCRGYTSFVFGGGFGTWNDPLAVTLIVTVPVILFIAGSYLISSINDGEGKLRQIFIAIAYAFSAYILFAPVLAIASHALTMTEIFIYNFCRFILLGYTGIMIFFAIKETHCYTPKKTFANIILTLAFMVIAVLACIILYILWKELISFVLAIVEEVKYRVFN